MVLTVVTKAVVMVIFGSFVLSVGGRAAPGPWGAARALSAGVPAGARRPAPPT